RQPTDGGTPDVLELAEAIAAGRLPRSQAEATIRGRHADDPGATTAELAELDELVAAIGGVRQHAVAFRRSVDERSLGPVVAGMPPADGTVDPRRVVAGDVRLRSRSTRSRWAAPGLLAAAALVVIAVVVGSNLATAPVAGSPSPSPASSGIAIATGTPGASASVGASPSPTIPAIGPSIVPTPTTAPSPVPTAAPGVPAIPSAPLSGAPTVAYWTLTTETKVTVTAWSPDGSAPRFAFTVSTWQDPDRASGSVIDRRIVVSPDGRRVVFAETEFSPTSRARLRVLDTSGTVLWTDPSPTGTPDLAWSADGTMLIVGSQPATWKIVTFGFGTSAPKVRTRTFAGAAYRVLGFSQSGDILYGWDTTGEAEWWQTPFQVPTSGGAPTSITRFSGKTEPIAVANGTTPTSEVTPADDSSLLQPGVDPKTYRVLDRGGASGSGSWEIRDGAKATPLAFKTLPLPSVAWGPDGAIAAVFANTPDRALSLQTVSESDPDTATGPRFMVPKGSYWQQFDGARGSIGLLGLAAKRSGDAAFLGADELVAVDLTTASSAVFVPGSAGLTGLHVAGWITGG
ncbi:MAG: hypothetical protein ACHQ3P_10635, partial [Candidatus Limnocylindrales bacterium]